jgi:hypothetical protein
MIKKKIITALVSKVKKKKIIFVVWKKNKRMINNKKYNPGKLQPLLVLVSSLSLTIINKITTIDKKLSLQLHLEIFKPPNKKLSIPND